MIKVNQDDYAYAVGLIRAKEIKLLDSDRLNRMIERQTRQTRLRF